MEDAARWQLALQAHAAEHAAMRTRGLARSLNGVYGLGSLTPGQKTLATIGVVGSIAIGLGIALWWAQSR
jgi:hypothetical protein